MKGPKRLYCYDSRVAWLEPPLAAARARGWDAVKLGLYDQPREPGYALVNVHADPAFLPADRELAHRVARLGLRMVTDLSQVDVYERKREQWRRWGELMPNTVVLETEDPSFGFPPPCYGGRERVAARAVEFSDRVSYPVVSKADVGASSYNVRILRTRDELRRHVEAAFTPPGIPVKCCAGEREQAYQLGYVLLQEFVPHETTYRVNVVGDQRAIFLRHNYSSARPVAQTGNVTPVGELDDHLVDLLAWVDQVALPAIRSKFVVLDVLRAESGWKLLETSLRWPHPGARNCDEKARWFKWVSSDIVGAAGPNPGPCGRVEGWLVGRTFGEQWEVLLDELEARAFDDD